MVSASSSAIILKRKCLHQTDVSTLLRYLYDIPDERNSVVSLQLSHDTEDDASPPSIIVTFCVLKEILGLLPGLHELSLNGFVLARCHAWSPCADSVHTLTPPTPNLHILNLRRVAIIFPFDIELLSIVELAPRLRVFTIASCYALPKPEGVDPGSAFSPCPHYVLPSAPRFPPHFCTLGITFPHRAERERYRMELDWYDFVQRLPCKRGTSRMELKNVHEECASAVQELLCGDEDTLKMLRMSFEPDFQKSACEVWQRVHWERCVALRSLALCFPFRLIQDAVSQTGGLLPFDAIAVIIRRLPRSILTILLDLRVQDRGGDVLRALGAVPWATLDKHLTARNPQANFHVRITADWPLEGEDAMRTLIRGLMAGTSSRNRLLLRS